MKSYLRFNIAIASAACGIALSAGVLSICARADQWDKKTVLTVNQPIQVEETLLQPGKYVLKILDSSSDRHIVQIFNGDQTHIINTVLAIPNYRLQPTGHSQFMFWETPPGTATAMRAWFYPGDNFGQEFTYPKHLHALEVAVVTPSPAPAITPPSPPPPPVAQPETKMEETQPEQQPTEMAQAAPPPANPVQAPPPQAQPTPPEPPPASLPKTASPYPLFALGGVLSLGLYAFLRLTRSA